MKKTLCNMFALSMFIMFVAMPLAAHDGETDKSIEDLMASIREEQGVSENQAIDPDKVNEDLLEELGDAVMSLNHPDEREHEWMDEMMGGEDSESLRAMHRAMGYRYLKSGDRYGTPFRRPGMRGPGFYGPGMMRGWGRPMMNYNGDHPHWGRMGRGPFAFMPWGGVVFWIVVIILFGGVITGVVIIIKKQKSTPGPLDILKVRLAKGEITSQEFEKLKQCIQ
ncbi:MAG: SHOCT domain-containing protein [Spirochaetales bacterium]|nr:SHOCT domain-containing protein [Spirochaetales bacterium]